jgi:hypothetical protein
VADESPSDKKLIIDEDWKSQVQREKETLAQQKADPRDSPETQPEDLGEWPPASIATLISTLATQAMVSLGQIPNPMTGQPMSDLAAARHFIDSIQVLQEKTAGNLATDEKSLVDSVLHDLRMAYVAIQTQGGIASPQPGIGPGSSTDGPSA